MSDNIDFGAEAYQSMDSWSATSESQTSADTSFLSGAPCSNGDCENKENPAEEAWVKLVSAIPVADQVQNLKCVAQGTAAPSPEEVQSLVSQIRPDLPNNYALQSIAELWRDFQNSFSVDPATAVAPILRSKLSALSEGWQGGDFDAFAEQMEVVFANCEQIASDIGNGTTGMSGLLRQKGDEIYALQGAASGELPYPAPQYWVEDKGGLFSNPKVHVRAPFKPGDCEVAEGCMFGDGDAEQAMELGGFDSEYTGELNQYKTDQTEYHYTRLKAEQLQASESAQPAGSSEDVQLTPEQESSIRAEAERLATEDANNRAAQDYEAADQDYQARATEQNETVVARWNDAESSAADFSPTVETSRDTTFRDSAGDLDGAAYSPPGGGNWNGNVNSSGSAGLTPPATSNNFSGGNLTSGSNTGTDIGSNPWDSSTGNDDETSGGLASGGLGTGTLPGSGLGTGTGMGAGGGGGFGGGGLGPGSGLFGPAAGGTGGMSGMTGAGGAGRSAGAGGLGKGQGLFGKTAGAGGKAGAGGMMGGGRGANGLGEDEDADTGTWLTEDEDVWGLARFNDENDPLA
jgi:hypothetical protein